MIRYRTTIASPVGLLFLAANDAALVKLGWSPVADAAETPDHPVLLAAERQLGEYFAGARQAFDLPLEFQGTAFQRSVWQALFEIPYGEMRSYREVASALGQPTATRAVGAANGRNPLAIIAPCHRVIGADGSLTGFGGGMPAKRFLLDLERQDLFSGMT